MKVRETLLRERYSRQGDALRGIAYQINGPAFDVGYPFVLENSGQVGMVVVSIDRENGAMGVGRGNEATCRRGPVGRRRRRAKYVMALAEKIAAQDHNIMVQIRHLLGNHVFDPGDRSNMEVR